MSTQALTAPTADDDLATWLQYLEQLHPQAIDMGLERIRSVAERLQLLQPQAYVFTVAGTNGKGSTVRFLETFLTTAGYRTGVYISPHLQHYPERVRISGQQLDERAHVQAFAAVEAARQKVSLTYFEFGTLAALWLMQQQPLDALILEVGLGGRLDAVNIIDPDIAVLTSIGIDHVGFLGADRNSIGMEKIGIFRPHRVAICGEPELPEAVREAVQQRVVALRQVGVDFYYQRDSSDAERWHWWQGDLQWRDLPLPQLPLPNAATALAALVASKFQLSATQIASALQQAREPGRLQYIEHAAASQQPPWLLDVAHNPHAAAYLAQQLRQRFPQRSILAVVGMLADKDVRGTLQALAPVVQQWFFTDLSAPRGASAVHLASQLAPDSAVPVSCWPTLAAALRAAEQQARALAKAQPLVLICGSFLTVAAALAIQSEQEA